MNDQTDDKKTQDIATTDQKHKVVVFTTPLRFSPSDGEGGVDAIGTDHINSKIGNDYFISKYEIIPSPNVEKEIAATVILFLEKR